jgi:hypothetical protein
MVKIFLTLGNFNDILQSSTLSKDILKNTPTTTPEFNRMALFRILTRSDANVNIVNNFMSNLIQRIYQEIEINILDNNLF